MANEPPDRNDPYALQRGERFARRAEERRAVQRRRRITLGSFLIILLIGAAAGISAAFGGKHHQAASNRKNERVANEPATTISIASTATLTHSATTAAPPLIVPSTGGSLQALSQRVIAIDPGHNGGNATHSDEINRIVDAGTIRKPCDTTGTETNAHYTEAEYNLDVGLRLARLLRSAGARVVLTRTSNTGWGPCITQRAEIGNRAHADAAISIHADGGPASGRGFHVIYPPSIAGLTDDIAVASTRLARDVRAAYRKGTAMPYSTYLGRNGLDVRSDLGGLNLSDVPKVFIETGNMRNSVDAALLTSAAFRGRAASAIAQGLAEFLAGR